MKMTPDGKNGPPFPLKDAVGQSDLLRDVAAKIEGGELKACAPCDSMYRDWTEEEKAAFNDALGKAFGWGK